MPELARTVFFASRETLSYLLRPVYWISAVHLSQNPA